MVVVALLVALEAVRGAPRRVAATRCRPLPPLSVATPPTSPVSATAGGSQAAPDRRCPTISMLPTNLLQEWWTPPAEYAAALQDWRVQEWRLRVMSTYRIVDVQLGTTVQRWHPAALWEFCARLLFCASRAKRAGKQTSPTEATRWQTGG